MAMTAVRNRETAGDAERSGPRPSSPFPPLEKPLESVSLSRPADYNVYPPVSFSAFFFIAADTVARKSIRPSCVPRAIIARLFPSTLDPLDSLIGSFIYFHGNSDSFAIQFACC